MEVQEIFVRAPIEGSSHNNSLCQRNLDGLSINRQVLKLRYGSPFIGASNPIQNEPSMFDGRAIEMLGITGKNHRLKNIVSVFVRFRVPFRHLNNMIEYVKCLNFI